MSRLPLMAANCCYTNPASPTHPFSSTSSWRPSFCPLCPSSPEAPFHQLLHQQQVQQFFLPQLCPISTAKKAQGLKKHVGQHTTGLFGRKVPEQWLLDRSVHTCPVCSRPISTRDQTCCPSARPSTTHCPNSSNDTYVPTTRPR